MEHIQLNIMDVSFRVFRIIDAYTSLIWNEKYYGYGDFELAFPLDRFAMAAINQGNYIGMGLSNTYMIIEAIEMSTDVQNGDYGIIKGRSLESVLLRRIVREDLIVEGDFQEAVMALLNQNIIAPSNANRGNIRISFRTSSDPAITSIKLPMLLYEKGENLYDCIYELCSTYYIGFRVVPDLDSDGAFIFELYSGLDRSYKQNVRPWVVFSNRYENLKASDMILDSTEYRNCITVESIYTDKTEDASGNVTEEEKTIVVEIGGERNGLNRYEMFKKSSTKPEEIDRSKFGKPEDFINIRDYQKWGVIGYDSEAYNSAVEDWKKGLDQSFSPRRKEHQEWVTINLHPGDPGYDDSMPPSADWLQVKHELVTVPGETVEEWEKRNSSYIQARDNPPTIQDYLHYGWVFINDAYEEAYGIAFDSMAQKIEKRYNDAKANSLSTAIEIIRQEAYEALNPYLVQTSFEGEVDENVQFKYGEDYYLGDIVQVVNSYNFQAVTRVVGVMFSQDNQEGFRMRPMFESDNKAVVEI